MLFILKVFQRQHRMWLMVALGVLIAPLAWAVVVPHEVKAAHKIVQAVLKTQVKPVIVNTVTVAIADIPNFTAALGNLSAIQIVTISSAVAGRISSIHFKNGQQVAQGMPIVQLDNTQATATYQSALTSLKLARQKYQRSKLLLNQAVSQQQLDQLAANKATQQSAVKSALAVLNENQIEAPFSGTLGAFKVGVGDYVIAGAALVTLVNTKRLRVDYTVSEELKPKLKQGQLVRVSMSTYPKKTFYGTVTFISPTIDQATRGISVQAVVPNLKGLLSPGMFVHISQQVGETKQALMVPAQAVQADVRGYYVYKVVGNKVAQTYVTIGTRLNNRAQILSGLKKGDVVVTAGQQKLEDGSLVEVSPQAAYGVESSETT